MAYRIDLKQTMGESLRRIALEQIQDALADADNRDLDAAVHQVRMHCKKLRGLLRLVRPSFDQFAQENADFRDTARLLACSRDAAVRLETFDALIADRELEPADYQPLRQLLERQRDEALHVQFATRALLDQAAARLRAARQRVEHWQLNAEGFDAVHGGLTRTYRRARSGMSVALEEPSVETLHEWRKWVKYHWYHSRLLRPLWRRHMDHRRAAARDLGECLGQDRDLALLAEHLISLSEAESYELLLKHIDRRRGQLRRKSRRLGKLLFEEKPAVFVGRLQQRWERAG
ncbi:MAG: CHAD domain-containing protein [Phycisphaeraceae bacterium]|nr:CHAD domain-containing protein [Phycisphaeraceae bacterium]